MTAALRIAWHCCRFDGQIPGSAPCTTSWPQLSPECCESAVDAACPPGPAKPRRAELNTSSDANSRRTPSPPPVTVYVSLTARAPGTMGFRVRVWARTWESVRAADQNFTVRSLESTLSAEDSIEPTAGEGGWVMHTDWARPRLGGVACEDAHAAPVSGVPQPHRACARCGWHDHAAIKASNVPRVFSCSSLSRGLLRSGPFNMLPASTLCLTCMDCQKVTRYSLRAMPASPCSTPSSLLHGWHMTLGCA